MVKQESIFGNQKLSMVSISLNSSDGKIFYHLQKNAKIVSICLM